ncbi:hypothetical protein THAOC_03143, partial [Thalassiosira oceanica]
PPPPGVRVPRRPVRIARERLGGAQRDEHEPWRGRHEEQEPVEGEVTSEMRRGRGRWVDANGRRAREGGDDNIIFQNALRNTRINNLQKTHVATDVKRSLMTTRLVVVRRAPRREEAPPAAPKVAGYPRPPQDHPARSQSPVFAPVGNCCSRPRQTRRDGH